ncbi:unnamed protein product [Acanthoscelides obtectus]|uniref:Uncharacterized protein n=1 Tax=Acanthoscelides obtectus TaxID=200917 RepID=A0A9P0K3A9_ACAOB|nr:unnamed protein product [Acanthoscelides obtectus]CAK1660315.1 hypothetical protein AOBTE_LOCUS21984 [Acanthoscelides obtectus]
MCLLQLYIITTPDEMDLFQGTYKRRSVVVEFKASPAIFAEIAERADAKSAVKKKKKGKNVVQPYSTETEYSIKGMTI